MKQIFFKNLNFKIPISNYFSFHSRNISNQPVPLSFFKIYKSTIDEGKNPILAFHGLFGNKNNLKSLMNQICLRTQRIGFAFDLRNHGESPHVDGHQSDMNAMANDIRFFMENNRIEKAVLLGHSLGGRVVSQFAFNWPEKVDRLILVDISPLKTLPKIDFLTENFFEILNNSILNLSANINLNQARNIIKSILNQTIQNNFIVDFFLLNLYQDANGNIKWRFNTDALKILVQNRFASQLDSSKPFNGKSLIIYGENSNYVRPEQFEEIKAIVPNVKLISIPNTGHYLHVEKANEFINHVVEFLDN